MRLKYKRCEFNLMRFKYRLCKGNLMRLKYTVPAESSDRSIYVYNFFPVLSTPLKFFLLIVQTLVLIRTKFHRLWTKTFCLSSIGIN